MANIVITPADASITGSVGYRGIIHEWWGDFDITNEPGTVWSLETGGAGDFSLVGNVVSVAGTITETSNYVIWSGQNRVTCTYSGSAGSTGVTGSIHCTGISLGPKSKTNTAGTTLQLTGSFIFDNGSVLPFTTAGSGYLTAQALTWNVPSLKQHILTVDGGQPGSDFPGTATPGLVHFWNQGATTSVTAATGAWGGCGGSTIQMEVNGTTDVGYGIRCPLSDAEWQTTPYLSPWGAMFGCQELASPAVGSGSSGFTLAATASVEFGAREANWPRRFWHNHTTFDTGMMAGNGVGPDIRTDGAVAVLGYIKPVSVIGSAPLMGFMNGTTGGPQEPFCVELRSTGKVFLSCSGSNSADSTADYRGAVRPFLIVYDPTHSRAKLYTTLQKITGSYNSFGSASTLAIFKGFGANNMNDASGSICYLAFCTGSVAAALSDDGKASKFLKDLGWVETAW